jgi:hypothetical protein
MKSSILHLQLNFLRLKPLSFFILVTHVLFSRLLLVRTLTDPSENDTFSENVYFKLPLNSSATSTISAVPQVKDKVPSQVPEQRKGSNAENKASASAAAAFLSGMKTSEQKKIVQLSKDLYRLVFLENPAKTYKLYYSSGSSHGSGGGILGRGGNAVVYLVEHKLSKMKVTNKFKNIY